LLEDLGADGDDGTVGHVVATDDSGPGHGDFRKLERPGLAFGGQCTGSMQRGAAKYCGNSRTHRDLLEWFLLHAPSPCSLTIFRTNHASCPTGPLRALVSRHRLGRETFS